MSAVPERRGGERVLVRLSDVPAELRERVAGQILDRMEQRGSAPRGLDLIMWELAARGLRDASIWTTAEKADRVLRQGKLPPGDMPKVWSW